MSTFSSRSSASSPVLADVPLHEARFRGDAAQVARREVVEDDDAIAQGEQGVGEVGTDETGPSGDEDGSASRGLRSVDCHACPPE